VGPAHGRVEVQSRALLRPQLIHRYQRPAALTVTSELWRLGPHVLATQAILRQRSSLALGENPLSRPVSRLSGGARVAKFEALAACERQDRHWWTFSRFILARIHSQPQMQYCMCVQPSEYDVAKFTGNTPVVRVSVHA
jgi:hypothetical protein